MIYNYVKEAFKLILKSDEFKKVILTLMGSSFVKAVGFKAWLIGMAIDYGLDKAIIPLVNELLLSGYAAIDHYEGKAIVKKIKESVDEADRDKWITNMSKL